jgi:peptidoglycan hydrolase-like protein with peptidoglycan-binding domain
MPAPIRLMVFEGFAPGYGFYNAFGALQRPLLQIGSRGDAVKEAQQKLMEVLQRSLRTGADGIFGSDTLAAVREVQQRFGLRVDGIIGKDTWTALLGQPVEISGNVPPQPDTPVSLPPAPPVIDDGNLVVGDKNKPKADNTMLYVGLGAAVLLGAVLLKRR